MTRRLNEECREIVACACREARNRVIQALAGTLYRWAGDTGEELASALRDLPSELARIDAKGAAAMRTDFEAIRACGEWPSYDNDKPMAVAAVNAHAAKLAALVAHVVASPGLTPVEPDSSANTAKQGSAATKASDD